MCRVLASQGFVAVVVLRRCAASAIFHGAPLGSWRVAASVLPAPESYRVRLCGLCLFSTPLPASTTKTRKYLGHFDFDAKKVYRFIPASADPREPHSHPNEETAQPGELSCREADNSTLVEQARFKPGSIHNPTPKSHGTGAANMRFVFGLERQGDRRFSRLGKNGHLQKLRSIFSCPVFPSPLNNDTSFSQCPRRHAPRSGFVQQGARANDLRCHVSCYFTFHRR